MARRWLSAMLVFCLLIGAVPLVGSATEATAAPTTAPATEATTAPTTAPAPEATAAPTTAPAPEATAAPTTAPATEATAAPTTAPTEAPTEPPTEPPVLSGSCGDAMSWSFDPASGQLAITGNGAMDDFDTQPWAHLTGQIKSLYFGQNIRSITAYAFSGCSALRTIRFTGPIPGTIGKNAFKGVAATIYYPGLDVSWADAEKKDYGGSLEWSPEVPNGKGGVIGNRFVWYLEGSTLTIVGKGNMTGWQSGVENPPWYAYRNDIKKVVMTGSIYSIYTSAFRDMPNLTEVVWPDDLNIIYSSAFYNCTGLTKLDIPNSVYTISDYAFYGCENLKEVDMPNGLKELGRNAFTNCKALTSLNLPNKLSSIGQKAFSHSGLESIIIPQPVTKLAAGTFQGCRALKSVTLMGNVTEIGKQCFESCGKLIALELPASIKSIGERAFAESGLKELVFGGNMPTIGAEALQSVKASVFYPKGDTTWSDTRLQVLKSTYSGSVTFYAGTPDSMELETEAPTAAPTEAPTEAPTQAPTEAPTEAPTQAPTEPVVPVPEITEPVMPEQTEPEEIPTEAPAEQPQKSEKSGLLAYWPVAVAAVWFFGGSALAIWLLLIKPRRNADDENRNIFEE